ncbi:DNA mismatch repair protein MutS [Arboricoccus pini]|uniref:DNA mismatch repair protein MutS n=1 Tax=Arboricoccus pini TaxID=1963835 RepID=A0A212Q118_9PROT|nr:DNA mismatch repair protein MutS [Arboricoccus pini]SNB52986.1 DNA mismatch repair protein MutS [Arboricoccus pini]
MDKEATAESAVRIDEASSPMVAQFLELKAAHPGTLLFFRMGDFYELFFEDAVAAAPALDIALTKRGRHQGAEIPMCGVPAHNAEPYLHKLIRKGFKVAVCEQMEDPALARRRGGRSLVRREVVRIVTPGTLTEDNLLEARRHNYLAALARSGGRWAVAWIDISTGEFLTEAVDLRSLPALLSRIAPGEIVLASRHLQEADLMAALADHGHLLSPARDGAFESDDALRRLQQFFDIVALEALGDFTRAEIAAAGALLDYVEITQKGALPRLGRPSRIDPEKVLKLDPATRRNLELDRSLSGERSGSLLTCIDRTMTNAGARLLAERLAAPLVDIPAIRERQDQIAALVDDSHRNERLRGILKSCPDLQRALSRVSLKRAGPRDLKAIAAGLKVAAELQASEAGEDAIAVLLAALPDTGSLADLLNQSLIDEPPFIARDGGFVREGALPELDETRSLRDHSRRLVAALEQRYRESTGIATLKIRHNSMLGYFIEVGANHRSRIPQDFVQRQGMANAVRFSTAELSELEHKVAKAGERAIELELALFERLAAAVMMAAEAIAATARLLAELDVACALADVARALRWTRPHLVEEPVFKVEGGRHPVVEWALARERASFVANDCCLDEESRLWLMTGPNMAGKSTFLRQNALIVVLAQMGSFVPAERAVIGLVDRLFSRVGAADDLARGRSTFMVEMVETATILNAAGPRSFVILDEIGRGTATYDGLSLAWAVLEHLHDVNRSRGLFATHYHELTALSARLKSLAAWTMRVKEWKGEVVFLHEVTRGTADRSYGIHVAKLSGLPPLVVRRAEQVLKRLEEGEARAGPASLVDDLPLFALEAGESSPATLPVQAGQSVMTESQLVEPQAEILAARLSAVEPDDLTPRQALDLVFELKRLLQEAKLPGAA